MGGTPKPRGTGVPPVGRRSETGATCVIKYMNLECEIHIPSADRKSVAAGGNCVAAMRGGEQPEAEVRSQIGLPRPVNSIRWLRGASLRSKGEACRASGEPQTTRGLSMLDCGPSSYGWSENVRKGACMKIRELVGQDGVHDSFAFPKSRPPAVRASIVATKPSNVGGAKGRRKREPKAWHHEANNPAEVPSLAKRAGGLKRLFMGHPMVRAKVGDDHDKLLAWSGASSGALARLEPTLDRRAVCGRSACTVRREGQVQSLSLPLFH